MYYYAVRAYFQSWESVDSDIETGWTPCPTFGAVADTYAKQDKSDENYGTLIKMEIKSQSTKENRSFVRFDISSIPAGATIDSATLTLCATAVPGTTRTYDVHQVTSGWVETTLTWNLQPTVVATATDSATTPGAPGCMTWTVTADVQAWADGTTNNGWRVDDSVIGAASETGKFRTREDGAVPAEQPQLEVTYLVSRADLSGSLVTSADEGQIFAGGETLIITLFGDSWDPTVGADNAITTALINGIDSAGAEAGGWDAVVKAGLTFSDVTRTSDKVVTITLPAFGTYDITADETITVTVPATALTVGGAIVATPTFDILAAEAALSGSLVTSATEGQIGVGGETLIITLSNDTWNPTVGADNAITTALINGIDSAGAEAAGWDAVVKAGLTFSDVTRTSDTVVTITLPAFGSYDITVDETITVTVPATAVTSGGAIDAAPTFDILFAQAALSGSLVTSADETEILTGGETLIITLSNDTWDATVGADNAITTALINGIDSAQAEAAGWDAVVKAGFTFSDVTRTSSTVVTITLGAEPTYLISADETITVTVPATAVTSAGAIVAAPTFDILFAQAALSGSLVTSADETEILAGGETLIITLSNDTWDPTVGDDNAITTALINGIDS
ncbi:MAG: DNRLRE domain-containing protein, partial [Acidobacteria bacterium]|nr:DNRLRE domain-containing protein [Acidobacteriota bacterium]